MMRNFMMSVFIFAIIKRKKKTISVGIVPEDDMPRSFILKREQGQHL